MTDDKRMEWAVTTHLAKDGAQQPDAALSAFEEHGGRRYVVLRNVTGLLGVYRIHPDGAMVLLRRWPKGITA